MLKGCSQENAEIRVQEVHHSLSNFLSIARTQMGFESIPVKLTPFDISAIFTDTYKETMKFPIII